MITSLRESFAAARSAAKVNFLPGLLLQSLLAIFLIAYLTNEPTRNFMAQVAVLKQQTGLLFSIVSYIIAAALLPEILRVVFFQRGRIYRQNFWRFFTSALVWSLMGVSADTLYRLQAVWFGTGNNAATIIAKVAVDQFLYSPFYANPVAVGLLTWRNANFSGASFRALFHRSFYLENVIPVQVAGWCIWIPAVSLVYFMPAALQLPVAALIQAFWTLILTTINERPRA